MMLVSILMIVYTTGIQAQNFTYGGGPEYGTGYQYLVTDGAQNSTSDPYINLTMDCLAANGYGQWACSSSPGSFAFATHTPLWRINPNDSYNSASAANHAGWFLLGNALSASPSEKRAAADGAGAHPGCDPPGIVAGGNFGSVGSAFPSTNPKATANLLGSVRYVWIDPTQDINQGNNSRVNFIIQGLNDNRGTHSGSPGDQQIHIELDGLPNPEMNTQIVRDQIFPYNSVSTNNNQVTIILGGIDPRDVFDIACDTKL
jgi:hypothetical protein